MFKISFYHAAKGTSELQDFIDGLARKTGKSKDARVQLNQILRFVNLLKSEGTNLPVEIAKHLEDGIWEHPAGRHLTKQVKARSKTGQMPVKRRTRPHLTR